MLKQIVIAGSGGQGIQFAGQFLASSAVRQGLEATYVPNYGAERRGGPSYCSVVVADGPIYAPVFAQPDVLIAFDQRARNQYGALVKPAGLILTNSDLAAQKAAAEQARVVSIPASSLGDQLRPGSGFNLVMLGAFLAIFSGVEVKTAEAVLKEQCAKKPGTLEINLQGLAKGAEIIKLGGEKNDSQSPSG